MVTKMLSHVKLSCRMQTVADMVDEASVVDIGCDHAYVSIYLREKNITNKVIAMDVKKGPLQIAKSNVSMYGYDSSIDVRLSNGFRALEVGEAECAIIAGMGGMLIIDILRNASAHIEAGIHLVLQPQSDICEVRKYLQEINYTIVKEKMLIEEGKYYNVLKAVPAKYNKTMVLSKEELLYGKYLIDSKDEVLRLYLNNKLDKNETVINKLVNQDTDSSKTRIKELCDENIIIKSVLGKFDM